MGKEVENNQAANTPGLNIDGVSNSTEIIEMFVRKWRNTDKYPCPKCDSKLGMPDYKCEKCNVKIKLKMQF